MSEIKEKHWPILQNKWTIQKAFATTPIVSFKRTKALRNIIGGNTIVNGKVKRNDKPNTELGHAPHVTVGKTQCAANKWLTTHRLLVTETRNPT